MLRSARRDRCTADQAANAIRHFQGWRRAKGWPARSIVALLFLDLALLQWSLRRPLAFPDELYQAPRSWAEQAYPNLIHYNKLPKGGHFAAWEQPFLSEELRAGFKSLRK